MINDISIYRTLANHNQFICIQDLYDAYHYVCETNGITPLNYDIIIDYLVSISYIDHTGKIKKLVDQVGHHNYSIAITKFDKIAFISRTYKSYLKWIQHIDIELLKTSRFSYIPSNFLYSIILILLGDIILIIWVIVTKYASYSSYLLIARSGAAIILYNLGLLFLHISNIIDHIDHVLMWKLSTNNSDSIHKFLGLSIMFGTVLHIIGHCLHIPYVLDICKNGCSYNQVHIVPKSNTAHIQISWSYFIHMPAYYSGIALTILIIIICIMIIIMKYSLIRIVNFYFWHRLISIIFAIGIILHGLQCLLGFNLSYIFVLPPLLIYVISRRSELLFKQQLEITRWHLTSSSIQLYILNTEYIKHKLINGLVISMFINHPQTSKYEWHPFTAIISNDLSIACLGDSSITESCINIKRTGKWTNAFIQNMMLTGRGTLNQIINIGHIVPSCFRFHKFYMNKIIFCSGIGITPFLAMLTNINPSNQIILVWSIGSMDLIKQFGSTIKQLQGLGNLQVIIFYSNSSKRLDRSISTIQSDKFYFLQTLIHYRTQTDIVHGYQLPWIIHLMRANPINIISHYISNLHTNQNLVGIFVCGNLSYSNAINNAVKLLSGNAKKIKIDIWIEHL